MNGEHLSRPFSEVLPAGAADLIDLALAIYAADRSSPRGLQADQHWTATHLRQSRAEGTLTTGLRQARPALFKNSFTGLAETSGRSILSTEKPPVRLPNVDRFFSKSRWSRLSPSLCLVADSTPLPGSLAGR